jgi:hypothetical protein
MDNGSRVISIINASQSAAPDFGLVLLALFTFLIVGFSLLVVRQASQMVHVLPTSASPIVRLATLVYACLAIGTLILIISFMV